ncbi:DUF2807 domain-containing protein [Pseudomonas aeruginosa]|uniref:GIN domain-containing protein n=1 Tax=Pseudomonas aeruginosa TaxID=287 RepID=UPI00071C07F7|nr:DUF2807 domain-containing protein [Pseudomonas aeruginosa]KSQ21780.1 DUF2807 domain-containing protein [Pseudomonas aeruginosa]RPV61454.1 DUF2807 domain-containing protein [Pseudomonas aeruginosa]
MSNPLLDGTYSGRSSAWDRAVGYQKEERPIQQVRKIVLKGAVDVVLFRSETAGLVVAGDSQDAIERITTRLEGDKLVIEQEGITISNSGGSIRVSGSGNIVAGGTIYVGGSMNVQINGAAVGVSVGGGSVIGIALREAPVIRVKGSGDIELYDLHQAELDVRVQGSGDISVCGHVERFSAEVQGSGDIDAADLIAQSAELSVAGSGDIVAHVTAAVTARVAGSGDIVVRGAPPSRKQSIAGSGEIKFK